MLRIDFYVIGDPHSDPRRVACRLVEKAWRQGHAVFVHTDSDYDAQRMDDLLWTYRQDSFLPHARQSDAAAHDCRVFVGDGAEPESELDVVVNLTQEVPPFYSRCQRLAEVVTAEEDSRVAGRARYRYYREQGLAPDSHEL